MDIAITTAMNALDASEEIDTLLASLASSGYSVVRAEEAEHLAAANDLLQWVDGYFAMTTNRPLADQFPADSPMQAVLARAGCYERGSRRGNGPLYLSPTRREPLDPECPFAHGGKHCWHDTARSAVYECCVCDKQQEANDA
jgi:hypothetical protein